MKPGWVMMVLLACLAAGCTTGEPANPNLAAPKVVVAPRDDGTLTLFVHSAFGERMYDFIEVRIDNETRGNRTRAFSWEAEVPEDGFFLEVVAGSGAQLYEIRARVDVAPDGEKALVAFHDAAGSGDDWSEPRSYALPFERILERRESA